MKINTKKVMEDAIGEQFALYKKEFQVSEKASKFVESLAKQYIVSLACESFGRINPDQIITKPRLTERRIRILLDSVQFNRRILQGISRENRPEHKPHLKPTSNIKNSILITPSQNGIEITYPKSKKKKENKNVSP